MSSVIGERIMSLGIVPEGIPPQNDRSEKFPTKETPGILFKYLMVDVHGTLTQAMSLLKTGFKAGLMPIGIEENIINENWDRIPGNPMSDKLDGVARDIRSKGILDPTDEKRLNEIEAFIWKTVHDIKFEAFEGAREALEEFTGEGRVLITTSYAFREQQIGQLGDAGLLSSFQHGGKLMILGVEDGDKGYDHFVAGAKLMGETLGSFVDSVAMIGDTRQEAEICRNWNVPFLGVIGTLKAYELQNAGATRTFMNWRHAPEIIRDLEKDMRRGALIR